MDPELVIRAQAGDQVAFERLAILTSDRFHGVAFNILRDVQLAEDATQQALLAMWRDLPQLRDPRRFEAWSYRVLVRACHAEGRKQRRWLSGLTSWPALEPPAPGDDAGVVADRDQFERGFRRLSIDHRVIIVLHHYLGLTIEDVAATLDLPAGTARSRLDRAMKGLRSALAADVLPSTGPVVARQEVVR